MGEMKPTPGPWEATCSNERGYPEWFIRVPGDPPVISYEIAKITSYRPDGTDESDARLIAEAGTVFHTTGLSPVQLVEMVKELKVALLDAEEYISGHTPTNSWGLLDRREDADRRKTLAKVRAALAKCEGVEP